MEQIYKYPLDLSAMAPTNIETGVLSVPQFRNRAFALTGGSFYRKRLSITNKRTGKTLNEGVDFRLEGPVEELYVETQEQAYSFIHFTKEDAYGEMEYSAQMVGDKFENLHETIFQLLKELKLDNRSIEFENLIGMPVTMPPTEHLHHVSEMFGFKDLLDVLERYIEAVGNRDSGLIDQFTERFNRVAQQYLELIELINAIQNGSGNLDSRISALRLEMEKNLTAIRESIRVDSENLNAHIETYNGFITQNSKKQTDQDNKIKATADALAALKTAFENNKKAVGDSLDTISQTLVSHRNNLDSLANKLASLTQAFNSPVVHVNRNMTLSKPAAADHMTIFVTTNEQVRLPDITQFKNFCTITVLVRSGIVPWLIGYDYSNVFFNNMAKSSDNYDPELKWHMNMSFKLVKVGTKTWEVIL